MQDRPTAAELLEAVQEFLERDVMTLEGRVGFHGRVASNVVATVRRELELGPQLDADEAKRLAGLLGQEVSASDLREANAELSRRIRDGSLDDRRPEVLDTLRRIAADKLKIANPGYAGD